MRGFSPRLECTKLLHCGNPERGLTMPGLAEYLSRLPTVDRPVIDRTGLRGRYDVTALLAARGAKDAAANSDLSDFTLLQDFGLKLESQKAPIDILVIDAE